VKTSTLTLTRLSLAVTMAATGCSKDSDAGEDGAGAAETGTTGEPASDDGSTGPATTGESAEGSGSEESTGDLPEVVYGGDVVDLMLQAGIPDAVITVFDAPGLETVSDGAGLYEIGPLPLDPPPIFLLAPNDDYFGSVRPVRPIETVEPDAVDLAQISREVIDDQIELLQPQEPAEADLEQSIIIVRLLNAQAAGASVELDPPPEPGTFYAPDSQGRPVLDSNVMQFSLLPVVVYFNVAPAAPHDYVFTATHPTRECTIARPDFPTLAGFITLVEVSCPASS
jgi:hypothetical protein